MLIRKAKSSPREDVMKTPWRFAFAVLFIVSGINVMAVPSRKPAIKASNAIVTLDLYSGRSNPTWSLSGAVVTELLRRLQSLEASEVGPSRFDGLGYRVVRAELRGEAKTEALVSASRGVVTVEQAGERFRFADTGRQFELWLVNTGTGEIPPEVLQYVTGEIAKPQ
jgi:hypothetical protein